MNKEQQINEVYLQIKYTTGCYDADTRSCANILFDTGYRKQIYGKWEQQGDGTHYCSNCGHDATYTFDGTEICGVTCTFCGANMKGE
jgi:hypothetical protein